MLITHLTFNTPSSATLPLYKLSKGENTSPWGIPIRFTNVPVVKKPGKKATEAEKQNYLKMKKEHNLSIATLNILKDIRKGYDMGGAKDKSIIYACDGSFCNRTMLTAQLDRCYILAERSQEQAFATDSNSSNPLQNYKERENVLQRCRISTYYKYEYFYPKASTGIF
jgi:hypothetical protein